MTSFFVNNTQCLNYSKCQTNFKTKFIVLWVKVQKNMGLLETMFHNQPGITAKRVIDCVSTRLRRIDPKRWDTTPITFKTNFLDETGRVDFRTTINIHDALEREFGIDIKDKAMLINDIETAFFIVNNHHDAL